MGKKNKLASNEEGERNINIPEKRVDKNRKMRS